MPQTNQPGNGNPPAPLLCHRMTRLVPIMPNTGGVVPNAKVIGLNQPPPFALMQVPCCGEQCANWYIDPTGEVAPSCADLQKVRELQQIATSITALANLINNRP